jgi:hypothetical protein
MLHPDRDFVQHEQVERRILKTKKNGLTRFGLLE